MNAGRLFEVRWANSMVHVDADSACAAIQVAKREHHAYGRVHAREVDAATCDCGHLRAEHERGRDPDGPEPCAAGLCPCDDFQEARSWVR